MESSHDRADGSHVGMEHLGLGMGDNSRKYLLGLVRFDRQRNIRVTNKT